MTRQIHRWGLAVLTLALAVRLGYWYAVARDPNRAIYEFHLVDGQPYADAFFWDRLAERVSNGQGIGGTGWEARRPIYAYFLGVIYSWTGAHYAVAQAVNIALGTATVWLLFDLARRMLGTPAALAIAVWAAWHPTAVCLSLITLTETLGWFLIVWHLRELVRALDLAPRTALASGMLYAASNLTRTLTVFSLPGAALLLALLRGWDERAPRPALRSAGAFVGGALVLLVPFMALQWWNFGVFSLSSNSAGDLFAASNPDFGRWSFDVEKLADAAGKHTIRERYDYFMSRARDNLRRYPGFYLRNVARTVAAAWNEMRQLDFPGGWPGLLALAAVAHVCAGFMCHALKAVPERSGTKAAANAVNLGRAAAILLGLAALCTLAESLAPGGSVLALALVAVARGLLDRQARGLLFAANYLLTTLLAVGMFAAVEPRLTMFLQWSLLLLVLGGASTVLGLAFPAFAAQGEVEPFAAPPQRAVPIRRVAWRRWALAAALLLGPMFMRGLFFDENLPTPKQPEIWESLNWVRARSPEFFTPRESDIISPPTAAFSTVHTFEELEPLLAARSDEQSDGKLIVLWGRFDRAAYRFAAHAGGDHPTKVFAERPYARSIVHFEGRDAGGSYWFVKVVLPTLDPPRDSRQRYLLVGRANGALREYVNPSIEAMALAPWNSGDAAPDWAHATCFNEVLHTNLVRRWGEADAR